MLRYDVKVILNTEVNKEYVNTFDPDAEVDEFCETVDESNIRGDCKQVGLIYHAVTQAYCTAIHI